MFTMSSNRKKVLRNTVEVNIGCSCRKLKLSNIFRPKQVTKASSSYKNPDLYRSSSSSWQRVAGLSISGDDGNNNIDDNYSTTNIEYYRNSSNTVAGFRLIGESVAVMKDSYNPYLDFRHSMLQMILEKEIYAREDLWELLNCFLQLNSPCHHEIIVQAFTEIWDVVFSTR